MHGIFALQGTHTLKSTQSQQSALFDLPVMCWACMQEYNCHGQLAERNKGGLAGAMLVVIAGQHSMPAAFGAAGLTTEDFATQQLCRVLAKHPLLPCALQISIKNPLSISTPLGESTIGFNGDVTITNGRSNAIANTVSGGTTIQNAVPR
jgi:hypothetical protein